MEVNYLAIITGAVASMAIGFVWYGPIFGNKWMEIIGLDPNDTEKVEATKKSAGPLYGAQFVLTLFQVLVLAHLIADTEIIGGIGRALWIWAAFIVPTLAGAIMWTGGTKNLKWSRFFIQSGYQLIMFAIYGALLEYWV